MSSKRLILRGGLTLSAGQVVAQACSFVRNIIIARLLSPKDFGIAATFAVTISIFELLSNLSSDKLLVQAEDGNEAEFQGTVQLLVAFKGLLNGVLIFLVGRPIASLFGEPNARWAFALLGVVPFLRGIMHLDASRMQREMRFRPQVAVDAGSQLLVTAAAVPLAFWLRDYSAMLWVLILQAASAALLSHLVAERRYAWAWNRAYWRRIASFGWPLLVNGLLLFIILDGDRFIIGTAHRLFPASSLSLTDLGVYSVAFALTMAPTNLVANVSTSLLLPHLSRVQKVRAEFEDRYSLFAELIAMVAGVISIPLIISGGWLVSLVYGNKYAAAGSFIGWLAAMWSLRMIRVTPTLAAMAFADTRNAMAANIARTAALAGVLTAASTGASVVWIAISGFAGELFALAVCVLRLRREHQVPLGLAMKPCAVFAASLAAASLLTVAGVRQLSGVLGLGASALLVLGFALLMTVLFPQLRSKLSSLAAGLAPAPKNGRLDDVLVP